jgi:N-acetylneuraminic acid mutarotase
VQVKIEREKMLKKFLFICFLLSIISCQKSNPVAADTGENQQPAATNENKWVTKANMPTARGYFNGAEVGGKMYLFGGILDLSANNSDAVEAYDLETDTWTKKNKMPVKILGLAAAALDGKIYTFGGRTGNLYSGTTLNYTYLYDPATDSWTRKADMPSSRAFMTASVIDGKIYTIGGSLNGYEACIIVQMYDPATDTWTNKASLQRARSGHTANVFNGKIYVIGGGNSDNNGPGTAYPYFDVYDPVMDSWISKEDLAQSRIGHGAGVISNKLYICSGFSSANELNDLREYDFTSNIWTAKAALTLPRRMFATCIYNNKLFIFGGISGAQGSQQILKNVMVYIPSVTSN